MKIRTTVRGISVRPLSYILMAPYCFQKYFLCDFKFTSTSINERPMLKTSAFKDFFLLSFIADVLISSNLPKKLNYQIVAQNQVSN